MAKKKNNVVFNVTQLNALVKGALQNALPGRMLLRGQISNWKQYPGGHCYFLLKDAESQISCVMWASKARQLKFACENGMEVIAAGSVDVYLPRGQYQFYAEKLEPAGIGSLQLAFEQMRKRLEAEGLFRPDHKKPIPAYAMRIGVVTSRQGAAVRDITESIFTRWPCARLWIFDTPVQGEGAAGKIAAAITAANRLQRQLDLQVLIVGRGGGSMEDLWAFNEEPVARAIYHSPIPVISAVGHEVDVTIADLVADARASTPTRAGVKAVPDGGEVLHRLETAAARLRRCAEGRLQHARLRLEAILAGSVFRMPHGPVRIAAQQLDETQDALANAINDSLAAYHKQMDRCAAAVARIEPGRVIAQQQLRLAKATDVLDTAIDGQMSRFRQQVNHFAVAIAKIEPGRFVAQQRLGLHELESRCQKATLAVVSKKQLQLTAQDNRVQALNPRAVLSRGYSITLDRRTGAVITRPEQVAEGQAIVTELARRRRIESTVTRLD